MDKIEFAGFSKLVLASDPNFRSWWDRQPEADKSTIKLGWYRAVENLELIDCKLMLDRMQRGEIPALEALEYAKFGLEIRKRVRRMPEEDRVRRERDAAAAAPPVPKMHCENPTMASGFLACRRVIGMCREKGLCVHEEDRVALAVATLLDNPSDDETKRAHSLLAQYDLLDRLAALTAPPQPGEQLSMFCEIPGEEVPA